MTDINAKTPQKSILVVEDEEPMARAVQLKLEQAGYRVTLAFDGEAALQALSSQPYDLTLLDIMMPKVDGWEVMKQVRDKKIPTKIVVTSNLSQEEDVQKARDLGVNDFLVKSDVTLSQLTEAVIKML